MLKVKLLNKILKIANKYEYFKIFPIDNILENAYEDLISFSEKDPSSKNNPEYILESYNSYLSVLYYRIANSIVDNNLILARKITEDSKVITGIEIHPCAKIGKRFVIDYGVGTVIGETSIIGDDCYILQSVILGADKIANNKLGNRHPIIGNNVEIGGFSTLIGSIKIGDNTKIAPHSIIRNEIPKNSKVLSLGMVQLIKNETLKNINFNGYIKNDNHIVLYFDELNQRFMNIYINDNLIKDDLVITENEIIVKTYKNQINKYKINFTNNEEFLLTI
ncbi:serine O-acetyltransferase [Cetobacterium sp. ZOR0034]|uniref:serine O-acetyltransferase n=1 Tax=Cetobacterium sp. ZOR0034 TaxID=1339239 RepID=UPI0009DEEBDE|nr:hypothetical protein [Cetobacterium sp. ZOR0034]